jgi:16S rRNA (uracil1498-N3)-methyltransferase
VIRRIHTPVLQEGDNALRPAQAHHARAVLRLCDGDEVEVFDNAGRTAVGVLRYHGETTVVQVRKIVTSGATALRWSVASAVPKGERADWMVEKLSELGAEAFIPLATARSVVLPEGRNKRDRWARIATESAKQSRRPGVMRIDPLTPLADAIGTLADGNAIGESIGWCLSTGEAAMPIAAAARDYAGRILTLFIGPEGGWTPEEAARMSAAGIAEIRLTGTVLRVETAAVAAGAVVAALIDQQPDRPAALTAPRAGKRIA